MATRNTVFQENAAQRDKDVLVYAQFDGLRNDVDPERFELGDLTLADNVNIDQTGRLSRRPGYTQRLLAGGAHSIWAPPAGDLCLYVAGGMLCQLYEDFTSRPLAGLRDDRSPMSFEQVDARVYFTNGTDLGVVEAGTVRTWGLPVAPLPQVAVAVGAMPAGRYQFNMIWLRADGQGSGCGLNGALDLADGTGLDFTVPSAPSAEIVGAIIYLSPPDSDVLLEAAVAAPGQRVFWRQDPSGLSIPLASQFRGPPPAGQLTAYYRSHMFMAAGDTIYVSAPYAYEQFDLRRYLQLDGRVTMMAALTDMDRTDAGRTSGFFIGTERSTGVLSGNNPDEFQYVAKVDYGAIAGTQRMIDASQLRDGQAGARMLPIWLSARGVCAGMPDLAISNLTRGRFNFTAAGRGAATFVTDPARYIVTHSL